MSQHARITGKGPGGIQMEYVNGKWIPIPEDPGFIGAVGKGVESTVVDLFRGAADLSTQAAGGIQRALGGSGRGGDPAFRQKLFEDQRADREALAPLQEQRPFAVGLGQALPFVAGGVAGGVGRGLAGALRVGGVEAGLGGLGLAPTGERLQNAAVSGVLGAAGGAVARPALNAIQRVSQSIRGSAQAIRQARQPLALPNPDFIGPRQVAETPGVLSPGGAAPGPAPAPAPGPRGSAGAQQVPGATVGTGSESAIRRVLQNAGRQVTGEGIDSPADLEALIVLRENDFQIRPGQETGSVAARQLMSAAESSPMFADIVQESISQPNRQNLNRRVLKTLGQDIGPDDVAEFSADSIGALRREAGDIIEKLKTDNPTIAITNQTRAGIERSLDNFEQSVTTLSKEDKGTRIVDNVLAKLDKPTIKTAQYTEMRSDLRAAQIKASEQGERARGKLLGEVVQELDNAFAEQLGDVGSFRQFKVATQRFRLLEALNKPGVISASGDINVGALNRNLKRIFKSEFGDADRFGTFSDMPEFASLFNVTKALGRFPQTIGDSGTATRLSIGGLFSNPVASAAQLTSRPVIRSIIKGAQPSAEALKGFRQ